MGAEGQYGDNSFINVRMGEFIGLLHNSVALYQKPKLKITNDILENMPLKS